MTDPLAVCTVCRTATTDVRRYRVRRESVVRACRLLALCADCREPVEALLDVPAADRRLPATVDGAVRRPTETPTRRRASQVAVGRHLRLVPS